MEEIAISSNSTRIQEQLAEFKAGDEAQAAAEAATQTATEEATATTVTEDNTTEAPTTETEEAAVETTPETTETTEETTPEVVSTTETTPVEETTTEETITTETTPVVEKEPNWLDLATGNVEPKEEATPATTEAPKEVSAELTSLKEQLQDPLIAAYLVAKEAGTSVEDFITSVSPVSLEGLSDKEVYLRAAKRFDLSEDEMTETSEAFDELSALDRKMKVANARKDLTAGNGNQLTEYVEKNKGQVEAAKKLQDGKTTAAVKQLNDLMDGLDGETFRGLKFDKETIEGIKDHVLNVNSFQRDDGTYNVQEAIQYAIFKKHGNELTARAVEKAANEATEVIVKQTTRPSKNTTTAAISATKGEEKELADLESKLRQNFKNPLKLTTTTK